MVRTRKTGGKREYFFSFLKTLYSKIVGVNFQRCKFPALLNSSANCNFLPLQAYYFVVAVKLSKRYCVYFPFRCPQECTVFVFDKRLAEKLHKPKRREAVCEVLRKEVSNLEQYKHYKILQIWHTVPESK